jgi:glycolate oxidase iron-sulfur subunit
MQHRIPIDALGQHGSAMSDAVTACVHCGFCLPACPTYQVLGQEMDSPRGRIYLMKEVLEGNLDAAGAQPHIDRCLGCLACETACPSGVEYHKLLLPYRARTEADAARPLMDRLKRWLVLRTLPYPSRFRLAVRAASLARWLRPLTPPALRPMTDLLPETLPRAEPMPDAFHAIGARRARVALLAGCVQQAIEPAINRATIDVLTRNGVEVVVPRGQGCCGALAWHIGEAAVARRFARSTMTTFPTDVDAIVVNAAGCSSGMKEYPLMLAGDEEDGPARAIAARVMDVSVFLDRLGVEPPPPVRSPLRVAYHDACHLAHSQGIRVEPRRLLRSIEGVELCELNDGERCCGSAGTYNIDQPAIAAELGRQKAAAVMRTECDIVATGNIGCMVQMRSHLAMPAPAIAPPVLHTMQVLSLAYQGRLTAANVPAGAG